MKNILALVFISFFAPLHADQGESKSIDTSAVSDLITLVQANPTLSSSIIKEHYIDKDAGGLAILGPRLTTPENLHSLYSAIKGDDWSNIQRCASYLIDLDEKVASIKSKLTKLSNTSLSGVKVYGVVGAGNTAATASPVGVVLGLELICLEDAQKVSLKRTLEDYITHELVHVLQFRLTKRINFNFNLLEISILEGSADYIAELIAGTAYTLDDKRAEFGLGKNKQLITDFKATMLSSNFSPWLYTDVDSMPRDMGYWVGYQIAKAYVENGGSIVDLLSMENAVSILRQSGL
jgi:hypothetical protein